MKTFLLKQLARTRRSIVNVLERVLLEQQLRGMRTLAFFVAGFWGLDLILYGLGYKFLFSTFLYMEIAALGALLLLNAVQATIEERITGRRPRKVHSLEKSGGLSLLRHLPPKLRELIERGEEPLPERIRFVRAVVGFVRLDSETGKSRRQLFDLTADTATDNGFVVLRETSEGVVFLANYFENANWPLNLVNFYESLLVKVESIPGAHAKVGVSMGPLSVQIINGEFSAEGEEMDLAGELCNRGGEHQLVMTSKVWHSLSDSLDGWQAQSAVHHVPGFAQPIPSQHLERRLDAEYRRHCWSCGSDVHVTQSAEGYIRITCQNGHMQPTLAVVATQTKENEERAS